MIVALCDSHKDRLAARKAEHPGALCHADFARFLDESLDIVEILSPHPVHAEMTIAALDRGAHVSVQKPMAMSLAEIDSMIAAADKAGRHLRVFENFVFYPPIVKARELIMEGAIGRPLHCRMRTVIGDPRHTWPIDPATWQWRKDLAQPGSNGRLTFDDGHHKMAVALWLFGPVRDVYARIDTTEIGSNDFVDAPASITWRHVDPPVHLIWDLAYAPKLRVRTSYYALDEAIEVTGESGVIKISRITGDPMDEPVLTLYREGRRTEFHDIESDWGASFRDSTRHFVKVVKEGGIPSLTAREGREVFRLARRLEESSRAERMLPMTMK
jgi:predicted dehydrogenase